MFPVMAGQLVRPGELPATAGPATLVRFLSGVGPEQHFRQGRIQKIAWRGGGQC